MNQQRPALSLSFLVLSSLGVTLTACAALDPADDAEGEEGEGEEAGEGEGEGEGEAVGEGEGEGEGEGLPEPGENSASVVDGDTYVFTNVLEAYVDSNVVHYQVADDTGYWSIAITTHDGPGAAACDDTVTLAFSDFFVPFTSTHADASCGLDVLASPYTDNGRFMGTYTGTLISTENGEVATRVVNGVFDVTVTP